MEDSRLEATRNATTAIMIAMRGVPIVIAMVLAIPQARAEPSAADLRQRGEDLARDGRYTEAIDAFKAAERVEPRASHMCLIALAYVRRELWPQAEIFLAQCRKRATAADPLPDWFPQVEATLAERLGTADVAPVDVAVEPRDAAAEITISAFAPDEKFEPRTVHVPFGRYVIIAHAPGYAETKHERSFLASPGR